MKLETYEGIEVERCPACKGIYLDRGELEGMIAKKLGHKADTLFFFRYVGPDGLSNCSLSEVSPGYGDSEGTWRSSL